MNVSLRSQMVAGVAALGAAAVAITPITQPDLLPSAQPVTAAFELSALVNPIAALIETVGGINYFTLSQEFIGDALVWPDSFYGVEFLYAPLNIGIIPDVVNQFSTGPVVGLVNNLSGYAYAGIEGVFALGYGVADSVFNTPFALVTAAQELIGGDPQAALQTLVTEIIGPLQSGVETALGAVGYIIDNVIENVQSVLTSTLPYLARGVIDSVVGGLTYLVESTVATVTQVVTDLGGGDFEGAWNTAVNGILGADGTLGDVVRLGFGLGIIEDVEEEPTVVVPSLRSVFTSELQRLGGQKSWLDGGITNEPFDPFEAEAAAAVAEPAAALESAPVARVEAPTPVNEPAAVEEVAADVPAVAATPAASSVPQAGDGDGPTASTPKRSSHRVAKKPASAARAAG